MSGLFAPRRGSPRTRLGDGGRAANLAVVRDEQRETSPGEETLGLAGALMRERVRARLLGANPSELRIGRFELRRACGRGGEGLVYEAWDTQAQAHVALKCLNSVREREQSALQHEFRALSHVVHPNLVSMHELFCVDGAWFFTMELLTGRDIVRHVQAQPRRGRAIREAMVQLLQGLAAIHAAGLVHRDIKPSNVLVEPRGRVVLVDFGITTARGTAQHSRGPGTPAYMAPEQAAGQPPEPPADLYAAGAILFELLTGSPLGNRLEAVREPALLLRAVLGRQVLTELCVALLAREPARRPSAAQALAVLAPRPSAARAARSAVHSGVAEASCFVARAAELASLHGARVRAERGPHMLLVHGESGIGKSALMAQFARQLSQPTLVFTGRCYERESTPYKVFDGLVSGLAAFLAALSPGQADALTRGLSPLLGQWLPALGRVHPRDHGLHAEEARQLAFDALRELLARLARPVVLLVDDLQWGDRDSVALLEALFAPGGRLPILLVGNYRRGEAQTNPFLQALLGPRTLEPPLCCVEQLALEPLSAADAHGLVAQLAPAGVDANLVASARGVPFMLVEAALAPRGTPPRDVDQLFARRLEEVSAPARALLDALSVAGRPLPVSLALRTAPGAEFEAALELAASRLLRFRDLAGERCLEPYHDRVRTLVCSLLPSTRVRALHLAVADAMEQLAVDDPLRRVEHLRAAGELTRAAQVAVRAAELAWAQLAWSRAADLLAFALELHEREHPTLRRRLACVLSYAGRPADAAVAYMRAAQAAEPAARAELERLAAQQYLRAGHTRAGLALLDRAFARVGLHMPRDQARAALALLPARVRMVWSLARGRSPVRHGPVQADARDSTLRKDDRLATLEAFYRELWHTHPVHSALAHAWYCHEARGAGPRARMLGLTMEVLVRAIADGARARGACARMLRHAEALASDEPYEVALLLIARAVATIHVDWNPRAAIAVLERADAQLAACPGTQFERTWVAVALDHALEVTGRLGTLAEIVRVRERSGAAGSALAMRVVSVPLVMLLEDRPLDALALSAAPRPSMPLIDHVVLGHAASALLYRGEVQEARARYEEGSRALRFQLALQSRLVKEASLYQRARIATALFCSTRAPHWKQELQRLCAHERRLPVGLRAHLRLQEASIARSEGRRADCRALLRSARMVLARVQSDHAVWCVRYREAQLARSSEQLARAHAWFLGQGVRHPERWVGLHIPGHELWG
jgi:eukaryotic-like serine/threonine-protein kinase